MKLQAFKTLNKIREIVFYNNKRNIILMNMTSILSMTPIYINKLEKSFSLDKMSCNVSMESHISTKTLNNSSFPPITVFSLRPDFKVTDILDRIEVW